MSACSNCGRDDCEGYEGCTIAALQRELDTARNERIQARKERDEARAVAYHFRVLLDAVRESGLVGGLCPCCQNSKYSCDMAAPVLKADIDAALEANFRVPESVKERDEARAALLQKQNAAIDLAQRVERAEAELTKSKALVAWRERQRDELREKKEFIQKHYSFEAAANLRAENSGLRADVERLRAVLRDISYDKKAVAERQREACAAYLLNNPNIYSAAYTAVLCRDTPLVETED